MSDLVPSIVSELASRGGDSSGFWNDAEIAALRAGWTAGDSTSEISRRVGRSRNSVIGKANRLKLAPRPSPIRRCVDA